MVPSQSNMQDNSKQSSTATTAANISPSRLLCSALLCRLCGDTTSTLDNFAPLIMCRGLDALPLTCLERAKQLRALFSGLRLRQDHTGIMGHSNKANTQRLNRNEPLNWSRSFEDLLSSPNGLCLFRAFLHSEFSEENIAFYLACEDYRATNTSQLPAKAQKIYQEFISADAPREVNLDHATKALTRDGLGQAGPATFDLAQAKIHGLMQRDSYPRFLKSPAYLELVGTAKTR
ncbi:unnamed protein product [Gadus morhua 'NCC']